MFNRARTCLAQAFGRPALIGGIALSALIAGCGGGGGGGTTIVDDPGSSITPANSGEVAALTYGMVEIVEGFASFGDDLVGEEDTLPLSISSAQTPEGKVRLAALAVAKQSQELGKVTTSAMGSYDCTNGNFTYSEADSVITIDYNQCQHHFGGMSSTMHGTIKIHELAPTGGYEQRQRFEFENLSYEYAEGSDSLAGTIHGWQEISSTGNDHHIEADLAFSYNSNCQDVSESMAGDYQFTMTSMTTGGDMAYTIEGQMTVTDHPELGGHYGLETLETIHYTLGSAYPYAGKVRVSANDGSSVTIEYVEAGLYIDGVFYTWAEFEAEYLEDDQAFACF